MVSLIIITFLIVWMPYAVLALAIQYFYVSTQGDAKKAISAVSVSTRTR